MYVANAEKKKYGKKFGSQDNASALICPNSEQDRLDCEAGRAQFIRLPYQLLGDEKF